MLPLRLLAIAEGRLGGIGILVGLYVALGIYLHWSRRDFALLLMPLYAGFISLVIVPLGAVSYISMARGGRKRGCHPRSTDATPPSEQRRTGRSDQASRDETCSDGVCAAVAQASTTSSRGGWIWRAPMRRPQNDSELNINSITVNRL